MKTCFQDSGGRCSFRLSFFSRFSYFNLESSSANTRLTRRSIDNELLDLPFQVNSAQKVEYFLEKLVLKLTHALTSLCEATGARVRDIISFLGVSLYVATR